jgi:ketosteroid isomerase-like protein
MSQENIEIVRREFEKFVRTGDFDPEAFDPEVEFDNSNAMLDAAIYRGPDGLRKYLSLLREMWKQVRFQPQEYIPVAEDRVVVPMQMIAVGRDGVETVARAANIFTLRDGKVTHVKSFQSKVAALEAAGRTAP